MELEVDNLDDENKRLKRALSDIAREVGATDVGSCIESIRRLKRAASLRNIPPAPTWRTLYHITARENLLSIRENGIRCKLGERSQADGFAVPMIHCFADKLAVEDAMQGWVLDVFGQDGEFVILEFTSFSPATNGKNGPVLLQDVPFGAISVFDECFCPEDLEPSVDRDGFSDLGEAAAWLNENQCSAWRDGSRLVVDIYDDNVRIEIVDGKIRKSDVARAIDARTRRQRDRATDCVSP